MSQYFALSILIIYSFEAQRLREDFKKKISKKSDIVQKGGGVSEKNQILNV